MQKDENKIGALWIKTTINGDEFMSGTINGQRVVVFRNRYKDSNSNAPDFFVKKSIQRPAAATDDSHNPF